MVPTAFDQVGGVGPEGHEPAPRADGGPVPVVAAVVVRIPAVPVHADPDGDPHENIAYEDIIETFLVILDQVWGR